MQKDSKRYLRKRNRLSKILMDISVPYYSWREEVSVHAKMDASVANYTAEKILSSMGWHKPKEINHL